MILNPTEVVQSDGHLANESRITISEPSKVATHFVRGEDVFGTSVSHFSSRKSAERWAANCILRSARKVYERTHVRDFLDTILVLWNRSDYAGVIHAGNECDDFSDRFFVGEVRVIE